MMLGRAGLLLFTLLLLPGISSALTIDESVDGDLSDLPATPTAVLFDLGENGLSGSAGSGDFDLLAFTIAPGAQLDAIFLDTFSGFSTSFFALAAGASWPPGRGLAIDPSTLLGWAHAGFLDVGADILPLLPLGAGVQGFGIPLGAGTYSLLIQETASTESYGLRFLVSAVPEPGGLALLGMLGLATWRAARKEPATRA